MEVDSDLQEATGLGPPPARPVGNGAASPGRRPGRSAARRPRSPGPTSSRSSAGSPTQNLSLSWQQLSAGSHAFDMSGMVDGSGYESELSPLALRLLAAERAAHEERAARLAAEARLQGQAELMQERDQRRQLELEVQKLRAAEETAADRPAAAQHPEPAASKGRPGPAKVAGRPVGAAPPPPPKQPLRLVPAAAPPDGARMEMAEVKRGALFRELKRTAAARAPAPALSPGAAVPSTRELAAGRRSLRQAPALVAKKTKRPPPLVAKRASAASKR